jgi:hypothetical protein
VSFDPDKVPDATKSGFNPDVLPGARRMAGGFNPDVLPSQDTIVSAQPSLGLSDDDKQRISTIQTTPEPIGRDPKAAPRPWEANVPESYRTPRKPTVTDLGKRIVGGIESTINSPIRRAVEGLNKNAISNAIIQTVANPSPAGDNALKAWSRATKAIKDNPVGAAIDFGQTILESAFALPSVPFALAGDAMGRFSRIVTRLSGVDEDTAKSIEDHVRRAGSLEPIFSLPQNMIAMGAGILQHTLGEDIDAVADAIPQGTPEMIALKQLLKYRLSPDESAKLNEVLGGVSLVAGGAMLHGKAEAPTGKVEVYADKVGTEGRTKEPVTTGREDIDQAATMMGAQPAGIQSGKLLQIHDPVTRGDYYFNKDKNPTPEEVQAKIKAKRAEFYATPETDTPTQRGTVDAPKNSSEKKPPSIKTIWGTDPKTGESVVKEVRVGDKIFQTQDEATAHLKQLDDNPPQQGKVGDEGASLNATLPGIDPMKVSNKVKAAAQQVQANVKRFKELIVNPRTTKKTISQTYDGIENSAGHMGKMAGEDVKTKLRSKSSFKIEDRDRIAASLIRESGGDWARWRNRNENFDKVAKVNNKTIKGPTGKPMTWGELYDYAEMKATDGELDTAVKSAGEMMDAQLNAEREAGLDVGEVQDYIPHHWTTKSVTGKEHTIFDARVGGRTSFLKERSVESFWDGISKGYDPENPFIDAVVDSRIYHGQKLINSRNWIDTWKQINDPSSGNQIVKGVGTFLKDAKQGEPNAMPYKDGFVKMTNSEAPQGYHRIDMFGHKIDVLDGYDQLFHALTGQSAFKQSILGRIAVKGTARWKHYKLMIDTYHGAKQLWWQMAQTGKMKYRPGTLLDYSDDTLNDMGQRGMINPKEVAWAKHYRPLIEEAQRLGLGDQKYTDAIYRDVISKHPILGAANRFVFDSIVKGVIRQTYLDRLENERSSYPELSDTQFKAQLIREQNITFGNIQHQGWAKSQTAMDLSRLIFTAPQWVEGLIRKEALAVSAPIRIGAKIAKTGSLKPLLQGDPGMTAVRGMLGTFAALQVVNMITRGKPTWENEKGHSLDAFIPLGGGDGVWIPAFGIFAEVTNDLWRYSESKDPREVISQIAQNKFAIGSRIGHMILDGRDYTGAKLSPSDVALQSIFDAAPIPIGGTGVIQTMKQGSPTPAVRQALATAGGIKAEPYYENEPKTSAERQIIDKVREKLPQLKADDRDMIRQKASIRNKIKNRTITHEELTSAMNDGLINPNSMTQEGYLEDLSLPYYQRLFKRMSFSDAKEIYDQMPPEEKKKYGYFMFQKADRASDRLPNKLPKIPKQTGGVIPQTTEIL